MNQHLHVNKTDFHMKGLALGLALKQEKGNSEMGAWGRVESRGVAWSRVGSRGVAWSRVESHYVRFVSISSKIF